MSDLFSFNHDTAMNADKASASSGVHLCTITECARATSSGGAKYVEFEFASDSGANFKFVTLYLTKKDGVTTVFGHGKFMAMLGILGLTQVPIKWEAKGDKQVSPTLAGKKIKVGLQKVEYLNGKNEKKYKWEITHFFFADSGKTYSEDRDNKPANTIKQPIEDVLLAYAAEHSFASPTNDAPRHASAADGQDLPF
jgi:hypothetical protein